MATWTVVLLLLASGLLALAPAGAVVVERPDEGPLPMTWVLQGGGSATFDVTLPPVGRVTQAELVMEASGGDESLDFNHSIGDWRRLGGPDIEGFDASAETLEVVADHRSSWQGPDELAGHEVARNVLVGDYVTLNVTSPDFSGSGGGVWKYYIELEVALNSGVWEFDVATYVHLDIPPGHCKDTKELRVADPSLREVPLQLVSVDRDMQTGTVVHVEMLFITDMPPEGARPYRVYYGNPSAEQPSYKPMLMGAELWDYRDTLDPDFQDAWDLLQWPGGLSGRIYAQLRDVPGEGKVFDQGIDVFPGRTYSQVWSGNDLKYGDFQLQTFLDNMALSGPNRTTGMWGLDFRVSGNDCYRLTYVEGVRDNLPSKLILYRVASERHLTGHMTPSNDWSKLEEVQFSFARNESLPVKIRAKGNDIQVWVQHQRRPVIEVRDGHYDTGLLGTFLGGTGVSFSGEISKASCSYGPMLVWSADVNLTKKTPVYYPSEERSQHFKEGTIVTGILTLEGARDAILGIDVVLPWETAYTAHLQDADGTILMTDVADGTAVPEGLLDGGCKLEVTLTADRDHVTPALSGWGVGYQAAVHPRSDRAPEEAQGVGVPKDAIALLPDRTVWLKDDEPSLKHGNIPEDAVSASVGSFVRYGDVYRLYYTGVSSTGFRSICMAETTDGREFRGHQAVVADVGMASTWDVHKMHPSVVRFGDMWYLFYIGYNTVGQVGMAISGDGVHWGLHPNPVLRPSSSGGFDGRSIEDCVVVFDEEGLKFHMWYTGKPTSSSGRLSIGHATSGDGTTWTKSQANPVLTPDGGSNAWDAAYVRRPHVVADEDRLVLYYIGGRGSDPYTDQGSVGIAYSDKTSNFKKEAANPVLQPKVGSVVDDSQGITGTVVLEDPEDRHYMLYSGRDVWGHESGIVAESGFVPSGRYVTAPFVLPRAPRTLGPLEADFQTPPGTEVRFYVSTSDGSAEADDWTEVTPGEVLDDPVPGSHIKLRFDLVSEFGEETPLVHHGALLYSSNVRFSRLTSFPAYTLQSNLTFAAYEMEGEDLDDVEVDFRWGMEWEDAVFYRGHGRYGEGPDFGYCVTVAAPPGDGPIVRRMNFTLGYISYPSLVEMDVGDDGTVDWAHMLLWKGVEVIDVTDPLDDVYAGGTGEDDVTIPIRVTTGTTGTIELRGVHIVIDTPPTIVSVDPPAADVWVDEGDSETFSVVVMDLDGDGIQYEWYIDLEYVAGTREYTFTAEEDEDTEDPEPVTLKHIVSDGNYTAMTEWEVHVNDTTVPVNVPPVIDTVDPVSATVTMKENQTTQFWAYAQDPDQGPLDLVLRWYLNESLEAEGQGTSYDFVAGFDSAGTYTVRVEAFDGLAGVNRTWELVVQNVPRPGPGNGGGGDEDEFDWLPILILLVIIIVAGAGAAAYLRARGGRPGPGPEGPDMEPVEPVTAEVPVEGAAEATTGAEAEAAPAATAEVTRGVAAKPGSGEGARGLAAAAAGTGASPALAAMPLGDLDKDRTFAVEEVYVVYNDGRMMCHQAREERTTVDTDLFGGMFTAIQQFIHDSMDGGDGSRQVGRLDYGENRILVERGNHIFLAAIIFGEEQEVLRESMRDVINRIEGAYAGVIERWSGDQTQLAGVAEFIAPLIGMTSDLSRETIMTRTRAEGVKLLSEIEFFQGFVRLKVAVRNDTKTVITNVQTDIAHDPNVLRVDRIQPEQYPTTGTKVTLGTVSPREKKTVAYYLDPLICQESDIDGTATYKDAEGAFKTVTMKRRRADIVCPIFFTEENANTAMLKRLIKEELSESDSKLFTIPKMLPAADAFALAKEVIRGHDVRFVREFREGEEEGSLHSEAWFYGVTKVKRDKMVIRTSIWEARKTVEFFVASGRMEAITGLLAELGQNLNRALKEKYLGRVSAELVVDQEQQEEVKGLGLLIDKYSEGELAAGEVDQT